MRTWTAILLLAFAAGANSCGFGAFEYDAPTDFAVIFRTGYEPNEAAGTPENAHDEITYQNTADTPPAGHYEIPGPVPVPVSYEGGTAADRYARIIDDPTQAGNHVLHYWLRNATIPAYQTHTKGRIQQNFGLADHPDGDVMVELYARQRIRLHPDFGIMTAYDGEDDWWLEPMIHELWMNSALFSTRISIYVIESAPDELHLAASLTYKRAGAEEWRHEWQTIGDVAIPVDEWFVMEVGWKMGTADTGRFIVTIQRDGDAGPVTAVDIVNWTYNPRSRRPIPLTKWNPQKLYASDNIVHFIRDNGGTLQMYYDDFQFADTLPDRWR